MPFRFTILSINEPKQQANNMSKRTYYPSIADMQSRKKINYNSYQAPSNQVQLYKNMNRGVRASPRPILYVPRTPGGQVVAERKYFDSQLATHAIAITTVSFTGAEADPTGGGINTLFAPQQGNDISNREGRSCWVHNITVRGVLKITPQASQTTGDKGQTIRLILVMDKQSNGTQMASEDLIASGNSVPMFFGFQNTANFGRFQILKDKMISFQPFPIAGNGTTLIQGGCSRIFKLKYSFKTPIKVNFNSTNGGTIADIVDNSFHFIAARDDSDTPVNLDYKSRVSFTG